MTSQISRFFALFLEGTTIPRFGSEIHFLPLLVADTISLPNRGIVVPSRKMRKISKTREVLDWDFILMFVNYHENTFPAIYAQF